MSEDAMKAEVRVYCPICKDGQNAIWYGTLLDWGLIISKEAKTKADVPEWANYAMRHQQNHNHTIMVRYPTAKKYLFSIFR